MLLLSAAIGADGYFPCVRPAGRLSRCPALCPSRVTLPLELFKDFSHRPAIWRGFDAWWHGADRYWKWLYPDNFCAFNGTLKFSIISLDRARGKVIRIRQCKESYYGLNFGDMMQHSMKQITIWNDHTQSMFASSDFNWPRVLLFSARLAK